MQWGRDDTNNTSTTPMTVSFSLTFSILPAVVVTKCTESTNNYNSFANRVYSISLSSFKIAPDSHKGFSWIAIGI